MTLASLGWLVVGFAGGWLAHEFKGSLRRRPISRCHEPSAKLELDHRAHIINVPADMAAPVGPAVHDVMRKMMTEQIGRALDAIDSAHNKREGSK